MMASGSRKGVQSFYFSFTLHCVSRSCILSERFTKIGATAYLYLYSNITGIIKSSKYFSHNLSAALISSILQYFLQYPSLSFHILSLRMPEKFTANLISLWVNMAFLEIVFLLTGDANFQICGFSIAEWIRQPQQEQHQTIKSTILKCQDKYFMDPSCYSKIRSTGNILYSQILTGAATATVLLFFFSLICPSAFRNAPLLFENTFPSAVPSLEHSIP